MPVYVMFGGHCVGIPCQSLTACRIAAAGGPAAALRLLVAPQRRMVLLLSARLSPKMVGGLQLNLLKCRAMVCLIRVHNPEQRHAIVSRLPLHCSTQTSPRLSAHVCMHASCTVCNCACQSVQRTYAAVWLALSGVRRVLLLLMCC
jgi:hypothetical protein